MNDEKGRIVFVEFFDGRPGVVVTQEERAGRRVCHKDYCFLWSKEEDKLLYEAVGFGGADPISVYNNHIDQDTVYWADESVGIIEQFSEEMKFGFVRLPELPNDRDWSRLFEDCEECGHIIYCVVCEDHMDDECPCRHVRWNDDLGDWCGCGSDDDDDRHKESFFAVLEKTGLAAELKAALVAHGYSIWMSGSILGNEAVNCRLSKVTLGHRFTDDLTAEQESAMTLGVQWLLSLEAGKTDEADAMTVGWIDEWAKGKGGANGTGNSTTGTQGH